MAYSELNTEYMIKDNVRNTKITIEFCKAILTCSYELTRMIFSVARIKI